MSLKGLSAARGRVDRLTMRNLVLYTAHQGVRLLFPVIATPFLAHVLGRDAFADMAVINSCLWTSSVLMEFGFYLYGVSRASAAADDRELAQVVSAIAAAKAALAPLAAGLYWSLVAWSGILTREPVAATFGFVSMLAAGSSFAWYFQGRQQGFTAVAVEAGPQIAQFALMLAMVRSPDQVWLVIALQALPTVFALGFSLRRLRRLSLLHRASLANVRAVLIEAWPFFVERLCYTLYTAFTPAMVLHLSSKREVAFYSLGERFGATLTALTLPLTQATLPLISRLAGRSGGAWRLSGLLLASTGFVRTLAGGALLLAAGPLIHRFFPPSFAAAAPVAQTFCVTAVVAGIGFGFANFVLIPRRRARVLMWSAPSALLLGLACQLTLVPRLGAEGAVIGRLAAEATVALILGAACLRVWASEAPRRRAPRAAANSGRAPADASA
jgi:PST family polysaccharide transporter